MPDVTSQSERVAELRKRAEKIANEKAAQVPQASEAQWPEEVRQIFHELHVHQIELEMQNEELRRAQAELDATRTRYFDLFELAPAGYVTVDEKGLILEANLTAAILLGGVRSELVRRPFTGFILPDDRDSYYLHRKQLFETGGPVTVELRMLRRDGTFFWAHLAATAVREADGATACRLVMSDITERKQGEAALRESQERYATALVAVNDGLWEWHIPSGNAVMSALYYEILGYENGEFPATYNSWRTLVHPEDIDRVERELRAHVESGSSFSIDLRMKKKSGEWLWVSTRGKVIELDADGKALRMAGMLSDITLRKRAEAYGEMGRELLRILNEPGDIRYSIERVLEILRTGTGLDAVGIRLQDGEDVPYYAQEGFSEDFLLMENSLIARAADGGVCRDDDGKVRLECTCGLVLSGKTDPACPLFTPGGSFWTNDSSPLLAIPPAEDPRLHPRNRCIHLGFASVALTPIRNLDRIVGLIQLNDRRKGCFAPETIELLEGIASQIGAALTRKRIEAVLRESEEELQKAHDELEQRVAARTEELQRANEELQSEISDRKRAEEELKESQARFRALVENSSDWVWETDPNGRYSYVSVRSSDLLGYAPEEITGRFLLDFMFPDKAEANLRWLRKILKTGEPFRGIEKICRHRKGHEVIMETSGLPFFDSQGNLAGFRGLDRDITVRKKAEAQAIRTRHLAAIGELAAGVAHEINNPINGIINYAQILEDDASALGGVQELSRRIIKEGERIVEIVKSLLIFSRPISGEKPPVSVRLVLYDSLALFAAQFRKEEIDVSIDIPDDIPPIMACRQQIQQVLINILANSHYALMRKPISFDRKKQLEIKTLAAESKGVKMVAMSFLDNGTGIAPEILQRIFDPFFTTKPAGEGTGLGLSISYGIVKDHGGNLIIESKPGEYTRVRVFLPASTAD